MGTSEEKLTANVSRRGFLKGAVVSTTGALAAAAAPYSGFGAAEAANTCEDPYAFLEPLPEVPQKDIVSTITKDIIIVGAGNCGHVAALTAATEGASVFCVEKYDKEFFYSGRGHISGG